MLKKTSKAFRILFIKEFTQEILRHSKQYDVQTLESYLINRSRTEFEEKKNLGLVGIKEFRQSSEPKKIIDENEIAKPIFPIKQFKEPKHIPLQLIPRPRQITSNILKPKYEENPLFKERNISGFIKSGLRVNLTPETLPEVKPIPTPAKVDLGKINQLLNDPTVLSIECKGPDTNLIIKRPKEIRTTEYSLNLAEINEVIKSFSEKSKIPAVKGTFRVAVGKLVISATVSENPKFIITKMFAF